MNLFYFLRHGEVNVDANKPVSEWTLSDKGTNSVYKFVEKRIFENIDVIYSSEENKAYSTAKIVADALEKKVWKLSNFNELDRSKGGFLMNYKYAVKEAFANFQESRNDWESCRSALKRFREGVEILKQRHENERILVVSHGIVLTLYFAYLKRDINHLFSRWRRLNFLSHGIVKDSTVKKDIIE